MIDNLLKEGGGILRRLPSAAMAIMLAVTLAIPQGLALADPAPVSEDVEAFGHANSEAQPVISESNTSTEMADKGDGLEQEVTPDQETQPDNPKEENPVSKEPDEDSESIKNEASDVEEEAEQPVDPLLLASQAPPVMGSIARDLSTISGTASMVCQPWADERPLQPVRYNHARRPVFDWPLHGLWTSGASRWHL